jgi:hypothetical protein
MSRLTRLFCVAALLGVGSGAEVHAAPGDRTLAIVMTNDPVENHILVYDADTHALIQTLSTRGKGGVGGNGHGIRQNDDGIVAVVNYGSGTVAVFRRAQDGLTFDSLVSTTSAPVSIDFGNDHMYVAGDTSVDSFVLHQTNIGWLDGTTTLELAGGAGVPAAGSTAEVGVISDTRLLVTLKTDPTPGTVDVVSLLRDGAIKSTAPTAVSGPEGSLTPFGFSVLDDGTALITLAHSNEDGLFRDGAFRAVIGSGQHAPCWTTRAGKYVFTINTASRTISRLVTTGDNIFIDTQAEVSVTTGAPTDADANGGIFGVIDHAANQSHLTLFSLNVFGELKPSGGPITLGVPNANGVAVMTPSGDND